MLGVLQFVPPQPFEKAAVAQLIGKARIIEILRLRRSRLGHGLADEPENEFHSLRVHLKSFFHGRHFRVDGMGKHLTVDDFGVFGDNLSGSFRVG